jgi:2-phospho-L-lactate guanylyltransferase
MTLPREPIWAVVPIKNFSRAKTRLSPVFGPALRERFALAMADHVLAAIRESGVANRLCLLSDEASPRLGELALRHGAVAMLDHDVAAGPCGLNDAIKGVAAIARYLGTAALLIVHADLPLLTSDALRLLLRSWSDLQGRNRVALAPSKDGGTSLLLTGQAHTFGYSFGPDSHALHLEECTRQGRSFTSIDLPATRLDIDTPDDLECLRAAAGSGLCCPRTTAKFAELGFL